jgi:endonuclease/exonuclease/phosphatase family metal-dependent hydrolase
LLVAALACAVVLALTGWSRLAGPDSSGRAAASVVPRPAAASFTLVQMNLCLSGLADCYDVAAHPTVVQEAVAQIRAMGPDAVTVNEACRGDVARIARRTGYHLRFTLVIYGGERLPCVRPGGRGLFGDAVLTQAPIVASAHRPFAAEGDLEQRRWLCVTTRLDRDVCTAHLSTRDTDTGAAANDAQCAELAGLLAGRAAVRTVAFGGDVNGRRSCAPDGMWTRTDRSADQDPGVQHVYGSRATLRSPSASVLPVAGSDHDMLLVSARPGQR